MHYSIPNSIQNTDGDVTLYVDVWKGMQPLSGIRASYLLGYEVIKYGT